MYLLREARSSFTQALAQDHDAVRSSLAALHLAVVWLALESPEDVRRNLAEAHFHALRGILPAIGPVGGDLRSLFSEKYRDRERYRRGAAVANYANSIAHLRRAWGAHPDDAPVFTGSAQQGASAYFGELIAEPTSTPGQRFLESEYRFAGRLSDYGHLGQWVAKYSQTS